MVIHIPSNLPSVLAHIRGQAPLPPDISHRRSNNDAQSFR